MGNKDSMPLGKNRHASGDPTCQPSTGSMFGPATFGAQRNSTTSPPIDRRHARHVSEGAEPSGHPATPSPTIQQTSVQGPQSGNHLSVEQTQSIPTPTTGAHSHANKLFMPPVADGDIEFDPERFNLKGAGDIPRFRTATISEGTRIDNKKLPSVFKWEGHSVREVYLVGSFNSWKAKIPLRKSQDVFYTIVDLPEGEHEYKFLVDGQWKHDDGQPHRPNNYGSCNNTITVKKADFEVLEALALDSHNSSANQSASATGNVDRPEEFHQRVPPKLSLEKGNPPTLPPHLLQVILNKETSEEYDPSLLPEPNHVMLNHLYALSIKDNVLVLSATHRYRKRFVTTLFYKPINS